MILFAILALKLFLQRIQGLVKTFKNEEKKSYNAVDNLSMTIYSDQITAILGKSIGPTNAFYWRNLISKYLFKMY